MTLTKPRKKNSHLKAIFISLAVLIGATAVYAGINLMQEEPLQRVTVFTQDGILLTVETNKTLVAEILEEANYTLDETYERITPGIDEELENHYIIITRGMDVAISVDGQDIQAITWAKTVQELFAEHDITVEDDIINFPLEERITSGMQVEITRVTTELVHEEVTVAARTIYTNDSSIDAGTQRVQTEAKDGTKRIIYEVVYNDGVEVSRTIIGEEVIVKPTNGVVLRGTRPLASRGGSAAVTGEASWYGAKFHGRNTASGVPYDMNAFTAAHNTLDFGTRVRVTYIKTGKSVVVEINDRGPHVAGRIIDLSAAAARAIGLYADGIGDVRIEVLN